MPTLWRVVKRKHAATAFDGKAAQRFGGRWNSSGRRAVCRRALLLCGWLLMMPPAGLGDKPDLEAPMKEWDQRAAYDTAKDCENGKISAYKTATPNTMNDRLKNRYMEMRCVPADHIYPPAEPPK